MNASVPSSPGPHGRPAAEPAEALAGVWDLLDVLPRATASPDMTATTINMVAVDVAGDSEGAGGPGRQSPGRSWARPLAAAAAVIGSLVAGFAAGRATVPGPDVRMLHYLPVVRNLDLLREAGSVEFLAEVAGRHYPPPRRPPLGRPIVEDARRFAAAIESFRFLRDEDQDDPAWLERRRREAERLSAMDRRELDAVAERFLELPPDERRELVELARALADPGRRELAFAARLWHQWITWRDPADRQPIIDLDTQQRLEWLDLQAGSEGPPDGRPEHGPDNRPEHRPPRDRDRPPPEWDHDDRRWPPPPGPPGPRPRGPRGPGPGGPGPGGPEPGGPRPPSAAS